MVNRRPEGFEIPFKNTSQYLNMNYHGSVYFSTSLKRPEPYKEAKKQAFIGLVEKNQHLNVVLCT